MKRVSEIDVGTIVQKECPTCKVVSPMRFDGLIIVPSDEEEYKRLMPTLYEKYKDYGNFTCQEPKCIGTFCYPIKVNEIE
jgi:hypothetical protein